MITKSLDAFILHKQWIGDTSINVVFFTRELGIISSLFKGGRTSKKQAFLQAFMPLWISVNERYDRYYVKTVESTSPMFLFEKNALFSALYVNELLYYTLGPHAPDFNLFDVYLFTLNGLASNDNRLVIEALLRRFEWALLSACGHSFSLIVEARTGHEINNDAYYQFIAGEGFVPESKGISGAHILALAAGKLNELIYLKSAKIIMRKAIDHLLNGKEIKSRSLFV